MSKGTVEHPYYRKIEDQSHATKLFFIVCDEGWRESIVCSGMYEWAADWLVGQLQGKPFAIPPSHRTVLDIRRMAERAVDIAKAI